MASNELIAGIAAVEAMIVRVEPKIEAIQPSSTAWMVASEARRNWPSLMMRGNYRIRGGCDDQLTGMPRIRISSLLVILTD